MRMSEATDAAFCSVVRVTLTGSSTPILIMSPHSPLAEFKPSPAGRVATLSTTTAPSKPAFFAMVATGAVSAFFTISMPIFSSGSS